MTERRAQAPMRFATIANRRIEYRSIPGDAARPPLVFLHEGLGSAALWRDFPDRLAARLGSSALLYSRVGYGHSDGLEAKRTPGFMHEEALSVLPALLDHLGLSNAVLVGHSDGASIALIYAALAGRPLAGLVLMAPHVFVEPLCLESIAKIRETYRATLDEASGLKSRLAKYHARVEDAFLGWADVWLLPQFRSWNIEDLLGAITAPMLLIQGLNDAYGTLAQLDSITARASVPVSRLVLENCGHSPHRDCEAAVIAAVAAFADRL
jgi:pimeloyl-ACP methyl ester carboxylesterase